MITFETKYMDDIYIESSQINEILIASSDTTSIGTLVSITGREVVKTGGLALLTYLSVGQAIKINNEIKRVYSIEDDDTFFVTRDFQDTHLAGDTLYIDFSNNLQNVLTDIGFVYLLQSDSFENQVPISDLVGGILSINRCSQFTNATSLFLYDDAINMTEREQSFITGTYNLDERNASNVRNPFLAKLNRQLYYIVDMEIANLELDDDGIVTSTFQQNIYSVKLNGVVVESSDYAITDSTTFEITNKDLLRGSFDYVEILHFPEQYEYVQNNSVEIRLGTYSYDKLFMLNDIDLDDLNHMCIRTDFSSQPNYDFYEVNNDRLKQKEKIKVGIASKITLTNRISEQSDDDKLVQRHLQYYIDNLDKFRIIRKVEDSGVYEFHNNARLVDAVTFNEGDNNTYSYSIDFLQKVLISPNTWGEKKWGEFYWGINRTSIE